MEIISIVIANLIWILYSMSEGIREGFFNHYKKISRQDNTSNTKIIFMTQRILVLLATGALMSHTIGWISIPFLIAQYFIFKYFHKLVFEKTINHLDHKKFIDIHPTPKVDVKKTTPMLLGLFIQVFVYIFLI